MPENLLVPIHVDGLLATRHVRAVRPFFDFTRLPHVDEDEVGWLHDRNAQSPWATSTVASGALDDLGTTLLPGAHLHWALPDALTTARHPVLDGVPDRSQLVFPPVPNRWVVVRRLGNIVQRRWLVDSDYLWPSDTEWGVIRRTEFEDRLAQDGAAIWNWLLGEAGWLSPSWGDDRATVVDQTLRLRSDLGPFQVRRAEILRALHDLDEANGIRPADLTSYWVPGPPDGHVRTPPPFRHIGRRHVLGDDGAGAAPDDAATHLTDLEGPLTAVGYGEPSFAALYPNCRSVFGLHDDRATDSASLSYDVFGWYADPDDDVVRSTLAERPDVPPAELVGVLQSAYRWTLDGPDPTAVPSGMLCYGRVRRGSFVHATDAQVRGTAVPSIRDIAPDTPVHATAAAVDVAGEVHLAIANTGTEAVSAYIADRLAAHRHPRDPASRRVEKQRVEEYLEALHLADGREHQQVDLGAVFDEARHRKSFTPIPSSPRWVIRVRPVHVDVADAASAAVPDGAIPPELTAEIDALNAAQRLHDRGRWDLEAARWQLYADWYRYIISAYPDDDALRDVETARGGHDVDRIIAYLRIRLRQLHDLETRVDGRREPLLGAHHDPPSLKVLLEQHVTTVGQLIDQHNASQAPDTPTTWVLDQAPGPRFWQPNDPVVLLHGPPARPGDRHGEDGAHHPDGFLSCAVADVGDPRTADTIVQVADHITAALDALEASHTPCVGVRRGHGPLAHPFMLEWEAELQPLVQGTNVSSLDGQFAPTFIRDHYDLGQHDTALDERLGLLATTRSATTLRGRGFFTPHAGALSTTRLETYLRRRLDDWFDAHDTPTADRSLDVLTRQRGEIRDWFLVRARVERMQADGDALDRLHALAPDGAVHAIATDGQMADAIRRAVASMPADILSDRIGLDDASATAIVARQATSPPVHDLDEISTLAGGAPAFAAIIRFAHSNGWFDSRPADGFVATPGLVEELSSYNGIPRGGPIEEAVVALVNDAPATQLRDRVGLTPNVITELQRHRPLTSFTHLAEVPLVGVRTVVRLLQDADRERGFWVVADAEGQISEPGEGEDMIDLEPALRGIRHADPITTALDAHLLMAEGFHGQTQALTGFTDGLLMRRRGWQLPVGDPLGFDDYRAFSELGVRPAVGEPDNAPAVSGDFHPIRNGDLQLTRLRLVDSFGQARDVVVDDAITTTDMTTSRPMGATLRPRINQPARVDLEWLDGTVPDRRWTRHPGTSPVCGWVVNDNLNDRLLVHADDGSALGSLDATGTWRPPPGPTGGVTSPDDISNPAMKRMVKWVQRRAKAHRSEEDDFLGRFTQVLESGLEHIDPEGFAHHQAQALFMGRPMALVRASVQVELRDPPAARQDLPAFLRELQGHRRTDDGYPSVQIPVRIGEHMRLNDGVVGFWTEAPSGRTASIEESDFFAPQSDWVADEDLRVYRHRPQHLWLAPADDPTTLTLLVDPQGSVHATSGVLPTVHLDLPSSVCAPALRRLAVAFPVAPILTDDTRVTLDPPTLPGWTASWVAQHDGTWQTTPATPIIARQALTTAFGADGDAIWDQLASAGWLIPESADSATVPRVERHPTDLGSFADRAPAIIRVLELKAQGIRPTTTRPTFTTQRLREGWLRLDPDHPSGADT